MSVSGLDVRKGLLASTIASEFYDCNVCIFFVMIKPLDVTKHYTLLNHSLMSAEAAKRLSVDWMPSMYVLNCLSCWYTKVILSNTETP
jgi:hypothetical protein